MIQSCKEYPIKTIFERNANFFYQIPKYQREYTWGITDWDNLYNDINEGELGYFIGSIICINASGDSMNPRLELVDGQQRLTTISLMLLAIYHELSAREEYVEEEEKDEIPAIKKQLSNKKSPNGLIIVPQVQNSNADDYKSLMSENHVTSTSPQKPYAKLRKVYKCYNYFLNRLQKDIEEKNTEIEKVQWLFDFLEKVNSSMLVKIEVNSPSGAFVLFESLNNRGVPLTAIDLMKNHIMAQSEKFRLNIDDCYNRWNDLLTKLSDDYKIHERFFRHYYNAFRSELNKPFVSEEEKKKYPLGPIATRSNLLKIYEVLIDKDLENFMSKIIEAGSIYSQICCISTEGVNDNIAKALQKLNHIQGAPAYLLLLYLFKNKESLKITDSQMCKIINWLTIFFVRRNLTDVPNTRDLARIFMSIIEEIENDSYVGDKVLAIIHSRIKNACADDNSFKEKLEGDIYKDNADATRFLLCDFAEQSMTTETWTDLWDRDKGGKYIWTIEHIFPEGDNIPQPWVNMIANGDKAKAEEYRQCYVHKLGNLTITGYNSTLSNYDFIKKRDRKNSDGRFVGYKNSLEINAEIAKKDSWSVEDIQNRTNELVAKFLKIYAFPDNV